jgi:hypothetical protein
LEARVKRQTKDSRKHAKPFLDDTDFPFRRLAAPAGCKKLIMQSDKCQATTLQLGEKESRWSLVSGHDFSHAEKGIQNEGGL